GVTHRDIKPENVMLRPDGLVKVLDFGLAKLTGTRNAEYGIRYEDAETQAQTWQDTPHSAFRIPHSTAPGLLMGTVSYMSPEQARGLKADHHTDIFSLGVMLYEMLAGRHPFEGATPSDVIAMILRDEPAPLDQSRPGLPPELQPALNRMLAREGVARYQSAAELLVELQRIVRNRLEKDGERKYQSTRSLRLAGHKWIYVAVALVLLVFSATALYLLNRVNHEGPSTNQEIRAL